LCKKQAPARRTPWQGGCLFSTKHHKETDFEYILSQRGQAIRPSPTYEVDRFVKELRDSGKQVINLGIGNPPQIHQLMSPAMKERISAAFQEAFAKLGSYYPAAGLEKLRRLWLVILGGIVLLRLRLLGMLARVVWKQRFLLLQTRGQGHCSDAVLAEPS